MARRKHRRFKAHRAKPGSSPGLLHIDPEALPTRIRVMAYGPDGLEEADVADVQGLQKYAGRFPVVWIDVTGLGTESVLRELGDTFRLHRLTLEDAVHVGQRAKLEAYDDYLFFVARMAPREAHDRYEQLSLILGKGFILTLQERAGDCFEPVRQRIRDASGRIRSRGPDYLTYALLDAVIDGYFPFLERTGEEIYALEEEALDAPTPQTLGKIRMARVELLELRRTVWPHREAINALVRDDSPFVSDTTQLYLRDCYDHAIRVLDLIEAYRELSSDLMSVYLSAISNRMNEVMKVLTIIATIFIPLGFIAGLYGMNFANMPELGWRYGYPFALALMAAVAGGLVLYFKRRDWF